jgi:acetyltransferase-like isoleucine patch superfamily enzyme
MNIIIYEDEVYKNFLPLVWTRPIYDLRCGINTLAEKIIRHYPKAKVDFSCRYYLPGTKIMRFEKGLFINGRILPNSQLAKDIPIKGKDEVFFSGDEIVAIRAVSKSFDEVRKKAKAKRVNVKVLQYPFELLTENGAQLALDRKYRKGVTGKIHKSAVIYNPKDVFVEAGAEIEACAVLDARSGPIYIGKGTIVRPQSYLRGPLSIGPECRIGGEVTSSIIHGYSNKAHYGFIGHSYIGEWVNLGAGTTNSNLKNTYGTVKFIINGKLVDSKEKFFGCIIADHARTGIGTLITTGAVIGVGANIFGGGVTPKIVPAFRWGEKEKYKLEKAIETIKTVKGRRNQPLNEKEEKLIRYLYKHPS